MTAPTNLNEFFEAMDGASEIVMKLTLCEALVYYLQNPESDVSISSPSDFCLKLIELMTSPSLKVSLKALEAALEVLERIPYVFKPCVSYCFPALIERLGDSKEMVRSKVHQVLMTFVEKNILTPQALHEKLAQHGYQHKNSVVRLESLKCLMNILVMFGARSLALSAPTQIFLKLYLDQSELVREEAGNVLVEIYKQVGEKLRQKIRTLHKEQIPAQRLNVLFSKFDAIKEEKAVGGERGATSLMALADVLDVVDDAGVRGDAMEFKAHPSSASTSAVAQSRTEIKTPLASAGSRTAGAIDEASFMAAFLDVPVLTVATAQELREHVKAIAQLIVDQDQEWDRRVDALRKIRSITIAAQYQADFAEVIKELKIPLLDCLKDLRSQVIREECITIAFLAQRLTTRFAVVAESLFPSLTQLIQNSAKVMSTSAIVCLRVIMQNTYSQRLLALVLGGLSAKSKEIRSAICEFIYMALTIWPTALLEKKHGEIKQALQKGIGDADPAARTFARKAYYEYKVRFPLHADELLRSLGPNYRRSLGESTENENVASRALSVKKPLARPADKHVQRASTALDPMAAQRASVRAKYAAMTRMNSGWPPAVVPPSMANSNTEICDDVNSRSRPRVPRCTRSQPASRAASPSAQFNYQTYQSAQSTTRQPKRTMAMGWSGSTRASREASPTRQGAIPKARKKLDMPTPVSGRVRRQWRRESDSDLFITRNETDLCSRSMSGEKSSDESDTSSLCDRSVSCPPGQPYLLETSGIIDYLSRPEWPERKLGLLSLKQYVLEHSLNHEELKRITEILAKMFLDPQTTLYTLFLDVVFALLRHQSGDLQFWLPVLLLKVFQKLGTEILSTIEEKIFELLGLMRESYPLEALVRETFRLIINLHQSLNVRARQHILRHISQLAAVVPEAQPPISIDTALMIEVMSKLIKWSEAPETREAATRCLSDLFFMNAPLITSVMTQLPTEKQKLMDVIIAKWSRKAQAATKAVQKSQTIPQDSISSSSESCAQGEQSQPASIISLSPLGSSFYLESREQREQPDNSGAQSVSQILPEAAEAVNMRLSVKLSTEKQTYRFGSDLPALNPEIAAQARFNIGERSETLPSSPTSTQLEERLAAMELPPLNHNFLEETTEEESASLPAVLEILRMDSKENVEQKKDAMMMLNQLIKECSVQTLEPHAVKIIRILMLMSPTAEHTAGCNRDEDVLHAYAMVSLFNILRKKGLESHFSSFHELLAMKTFEVVQNRKNAKEVLLFAENCLLEMAQVFPVFPILYMFHNFALNKEVSAAYYAIKGIEEIYKSHPKEELDPHYECTMTILRVAFESEYSAIRKAVVFCFVAIHRIYGETAMAPYLKKLNPMKRRLLQVYIQRQNTN